MVKMTQNLHTHSNFCDGKDTAEEMILRAIDLGFDTLGFSSHANTCFNDDCEMGARLPAYLEEIRRLKKKYADKIRLLLGTELDRYSEGYFNECDYDYKIASVHYAKERGEKICYDLSVEHSRDVIARLFGGNGMRYAKKYYETMADMPNRIRGDFVGHFDLLTKYEKRAPDLFDTDSNKYRGYALEALAAVREKFEFFEVNTGPISRGYKDTVYPAPFIVDEMREKKCKLLITTDCHNKDFLNAEFDLALEYIRAHGFTEIYNLTENGFCGVKI